MNNSSFSDADTEVNILDFFVTIAENIKILIVGPFSVGLFLFVVLSFLPHTYQSSFALQGANEDLSPVKLSRIVVASQTLAIAAKALESQGKEGLADLVYGEGVVHVSTPRNTTSVLVTVSSRQPDAALAIAQAVLEAALLVARTQGEDLTRLKDTIEKDEAALASARSVEALMSRSILKGDKPDPSFTHNYSILMSSIVELSKRVDAQRVHFARLSDVNVTTRPHLPDAAFRPQKILIVVVAAVTTELLLLLFVFVREGLRNARKNSDSAAKIDRIKRAVGLYSK